MVVEFCVLWDQSVRLVKGVFVGVSTVWHLIYCFGLAQVMDIIVKVSTPSLSQERGLIKVSECFLPFYLKLPYMYIHIYIYQHIK